MIPACKMDLDLERLVDFSLELSGFDLARMERDAKTIKSKADTSARISQCFTVLALIDLRRSNTAQAVVNLRNALAHWSSPRTKTNLGFVLLEAGNVGEASELLVDAYEEFKGEDLMASLNLAWAFYELGSQEEAFALFAEAIALREVKSSKELYDIAATAALLGLWEESVEYLARVFAAKGEARLQSSHATDYIRSLPSDSLEPLLRTHRGEILLSAVDRVGLLRKADLCAELVKRPSGTDDSSALKMFEATKSWRTLANQAAMP